MSWGRSPLMAAGDAAISAWTEPVQYPSYLHPPRIRKGLPLVTDFSFPFLFHYAIFSVWFSRFILFKVGAQFRSMVQCGKLTGDGEGQGKPVVAAVHGVEDGRADDWNSATTLHQQVRVCLWPTSLAPVLVRSSHDWTLSPSVWQKVNRHPKDQGWPATGAQSDAGNSGTFEEDRRSRRKTSLGKTPFDQEGSSVIQRNQFQGQMSHSCWQGAIFQVSFLFFNFKPAKYVCRGNLISSGKNEGAALTHLLDTQWLEISTEAKLLVTQKERSCQLQLGSLTLLPFPLSFPPLYGICSRESLIPISLLTSLRKWGGHDSGLASLTICG